MRTRTRPPLPSCLPVQERVEYSAEVLITRSDLDEKRNRMAELEQQVAELTMQTEYQLRLKDLHLQEKTKELTGVCGRGERGGDSRKRGWG